MLSYKNWKLLQESLHATSVLGVKPRQGVVVGSKMAEMGMVPPPPGKPGNMKFMSDEDDMDDEEFPPIPTDDEDMGDMPEDDMGDGEVGDDMPMDDMGGGEDDMMGGNDMPMDDMGGGEDDMMGGIGVSLGMGGGEDMPMDDEDMGDMPMDDMGDGEEEGDMPMDVDGDENGMEMDDDLGDDMHPDFKAIMKDEKPKPEPKKNMAKCQPKHMDKCHMDKGQNEGYADFFRQLAVNSKGNVRQKFNSGLPKVMEDRLLGDIQDDNEPGPGEVGFAPMGRVGERQTKRFRG